MAGESKIQMSQFCDMSQNCDSEAHEKNPGGRNENRAQNVENWLFWPFLGFLDVSMGSERVQLEQNLEEG